jgi:hypothetical protein
MTTVDASWRWALLGRLTVGAWLRWDAVRTAMIDAAREQWQRKNCQWIGGSEYEGDLTEGSWDCDEEPPEHEWLEWAAIALKEAVYLGQVEQTRGGKTDALHRSIDLRLTQLGVAALAEKPK